MRFLYYAKRLHFGNQIVGQRLKKKSASDIKKLMKVSDKIANLNVERYHNFETPFSLKNAKQAVLAFRGDVYTGLDADSFDQDDLAFAHNIIVSEQEICRRVNN